MWAGWSWVGIGTVDGPSPGVAVIDSIRMSGRAGLDGLGKINRQASQANLLRRHGKSQSAAPFWPTGTRNTRPASQPSSFHLPVNREREREGGHCTTTSAWVATFRCLLVLWMNVGSMSLLASSATNSGANETNKPRTPPLPTYLLT